MKKKRVSVEVECDAGTLYGPIGEAIKYLESIKKQYPNTDISLTEMWDGYENMHMAFTYSREETDEEVENRIREEEAEKQRLKEAAEKEQQRAAKIEQYHKLKRELGFF